MKTLSCMAFAAVLLAHPGAGIAAERPGRDEQRVIRQTLAQYPEGVREAVCAVAAHPELLVRLARIQEQSSAEFAELLDPYKRQDQEALWDLARFPGLLEALADIDSRDDQAVNEVLDQYPAQIAPLARKWVRRDTRVLDEIAGLNRRAEASATALLSAYPSQAQAQAQQLLQYPELLELLAEDLDQVVLLGDAYRQDPQGVREQLTQASAPRRAGPAAARRANRPAYRDGGDPEEVAPSRRYDYDLNGLDEPEAETQVEVVYHRSYYDYPYPYWFGYPRWYGPAGWYAGFNWRLSRHVSASIGIEVPIVRRPVPVYGGPPVRQVVKIAPARPHRGKGGWHQERGHGHGNRRSRKH